MCSTPEGIGAARRRIDARESTPAILVCSTPEGIGAATKLADRARAERRHSACSTPEGIGAARTRSTAAIAAGARRVLNARGHRSGEKRPYRQRRSSRRHVVLNARGHRSGEKRSTVAGALRPRVVCSTPEGIGAARTIAQRSRAHRRGAQRPRASERRECATRRRSPLEPGGAQRPRASERREAANRCRPSRRAHRCSTPEGIGAARTAGAAERCASRGRPCSTPEGIGAARSRAVGWRIERHGSRAQRPRASERREAPDAMAVGAHNEAAILGRSADRRCRYARGCGGCSRGVRGPARSAPPREAARRGVVETHEVGGRRATSRCGSHGQRWPFRSGSPIGVGTGTPSARRKPPSARTTRPSARSRTSASPTVALRA